MLRAESIFVRVATLLLFLLAVGLAAETRRVVVYAPKTNYQLDILVRDGVDYLGLTDLLEPLGHVESRLEDNKLKLSFNGGEAEFQDGKRQYRVRANARLDLAANFLLVNGRGYVPVVSVTQLLSRIAVQPAEFHDGSCRLFIGSTKISYSAELRHDPSRLVLSFPAPVKPSTLVEKGRVHLLFHREPVVSSGADKVSYGDSFLLSTSFAEIPGGAEFIATVQQPATVSIGDGGRTVIISPATQPPSAPGTVPAPTASPAAQPHSPVPRPRPFVILDAAHGGSETGSVFSPTLIEKEINLMLARQLQKELESRGISVVLTRVADNPLTGDQRAIAANTSHSSLYIAIHSSASGHGVRVYTSMVPALQPRQTRRSFLPWELAQSPHLDQSRIAASAIAAECAYRGLPVRSSAAPLRPLNNVTIAAVAVEVAPLGASADELAAPEFQQRIAATLATSIASLRGKLGAAQ
ncbi:MAG: hypothetical protein CXZ00_11255 [Acidobacteria bacterium]|nr:MAG: hypothetical protein CXZ00_11255 [Acidobacteriota bacterium]